jgi:6-pyruvoyltetrahydropterin/6-carboxytetrahydropterin synthase
VTVKGPVDPVTGMVMDLVVLKAVMAEVFELVDHRNLDLDVPFFSNTVSTTENVVIFIWQQIAQRIENPKLLHKVTVFETPKNKFVYRGETS